MENLTIEHIIPFVEMHRQVGYLILFLIMVVEGEMFIILAGILAHLKVFDIGDVIWITFLGVLLGDLLWYQLGVFISGPGKFPDIVRFAEKTVLSFLPRFREKPFKSIFLSKFIYGANHTTLILSGVLKVKFRIFAEAEIIASVIWVLIFSAVGYFFGYAVLAVTHKVSHFILIAVIFMVGFVLIQRFISKRYGEYEHEHEKENSDA